MSIETVLAIVCLVGAVLCYAGYRYFNENVYLTYKEQKVGVKRNFITKREKKK